MQPYLALITPLAGGHPDNTLPGAPVYPDQGLPGWQPHPDQGLPGRQPRPPHVSHPIAPGGRPVDPGYGIPEGGHVSPPIYIPGAPPGAPGSPEHPIYIGGGPVDPGYGIPIERPSHPWVPPSGNEIPPPPPEIANSYVKAVWNPIKEEWRITVSDDTVATPK
jgi:hypothetical protein